MKLSYTVEVTVEPTLTPEAELTGRQQKNIVGAVKRLLAHRLHGLKGIETGLDEEIKWAIRVTATGVTPQSKV